MSDHSIVDKLHKYNKLCIFWNKIICTKMIQLCKHWQELGNQRSTFMQQNRTDYSATVFGKKSCSTVKTSRDTPYHTCDFVAWYSCATKSCDKIAGVTSRSCSAFDSFGVSKFQTSDKWEQRLPPATDAELVKVDENESTGRKAKLFPYTM